MPALASALTCICDMCVNRTGWWNATGDFNTSGTPIQHAIDNATAGNTIYVYNNTSYGENVNVDKRVTLAGEGADVVTVTANAQSDHVFNVTANYVNISGFTVTGATVYPNAGIYLGSRQHCNISYNNASNNTDYGIYLVSSSNNTIYNNYFNNTYNTKDDGYNTWNITPTAGTNIIGGSWLGGNYWFDYAGADTNGDGLGDTQTPYNSPSNITYGGDYYPLVTPGSLTPTPSRSGGGGEGTYPPGWHETPTATDTPPADKVTPAPTKAKTAAAKAYYTGSYTDGDKEAEEESPDSPRHS